MSRHLEAIIVYRSCVLWIIPLGDVMRLVQQHDWYGACLLATSCFQLLQLANPCGEKGSYMTV